MDGIRANLQGEVDTILGSFLDRAAAIDALSKASCGEADLAAVETKYAAVANTVSFRAGNRVYLRVGACTRIQMHMGAYTDTNACGCAHGCV